ncbi:hypothetical protein BDA99DRAFT_571939 [Phascolomyces articulosus]|uniref:Histone chaperone RTT106/FACT complex subunit SPT16-like middle domain-containing protein n=1 Tax=Phascolomyces articulosus TaxID=60185 RepID=A0AAD5K076_9FUNG|nr:hypothetical protein BDA99DRAFT_571939 [Phascolomyces articulosus]
MATWLNSIDNVYLRESIQQLITAYPDSLHVVQNLINYYNDKLASVADEEGREHKKRKIDAAPSTTTATTSTEPQQKTAIMNDISFQLPARKKFNLVLTSSRQLLLVNTKTEETDYTFDLNTIQQTCCVPSPAPTKGGYTFILFFKIAMDPIVFSIQPKGDLLIQRPLSSSSTTTITDDKEKMIIQLLTELSGLQVQLSSKQVYLSTVISATTGKRPDEDRFYANVYLKNKEGCLYFLPHGILFGFKKPVYYFPLNVLASTFYSGITQHTFNLTLVLRKGKGPLGSLFNNKEEEDGGATLEFSMIEQSEFGGIDEYIKKMGINDKSMSEENMAPETKARKNAAAQQQEEQEGERDQARGDHHDEDEDDEENDDDFQPSDEDDEPLEYDTDAGTSQDGEDEDEDEEMMDEDERHSIDTHHTKRHIMGDEGVDEIDDSRDEDMTAEQDITKTDNESDDEELGVTEDDAEEEDEEDVDDAESESLGSGSEDDIDEDMREAKTRTIIPEDAKDELEDSD